MPEIVVFKNELGKLDGLGDKAARAYAKFRRVINELAPGDTAHFSYRLPRSPVHHRFFFWRMHALFDRQEAFAEFDHLLDFCKLGAQLVHWVPSGGTLVPVPNSIAWGRLDEREFTEAKAAIWTFLWTPVAQASLWPHLDAQARYDMVEIWNREAGQ
jgi:hypothetical protein